MEDNDYGYLNGQSSPEVDTSTVRRTQVYEATHKGEGYLPFMYRSFISFSYGGKNIEDFGLITVIDGDRMNRNGYADFEDITTDYKVLDGLYHWGTRYNTNHLDLHLATDGITLPELDAFLNWFLPGIERELILAEHPNRAIMARVSLPPELLLLPFEKKTNIKIAGISYNTSTTLYRGEINLSFVMDKPTWYAKINIFGKKIDDVYYDTWKDVNGNPVRVYDDPDALKIAIEDGIPISGMVSESMMFGGKTFANMRENNGAIVAPANIEDDDIDTEANDRFRIATLDAITGAYIRGARLSGPVMDETNGFDNVSNGENNAEYFYYVGTAPSKPILSFSLTPIIGDNNYILSPYNKFSNENKRYNTITIESVHKREFRFTLPSIYVGYNLAIYIFKHMVEGESWADVGIRIRDEVKHHYARAWAAKVGSFLSKNNATVIASDKENALIYMRFFLRDLNSSDLLSSKFTFNSETGEAIGRLGFRLVEGGVPASAAAWATYGTATAELEENVGDMVRSEYLIIEDRNYPNSEGKIVQWLGSNDITKAYSHRIYHDVSGGLLNLFIEYNNMYL